MLGWFLKALVLLNKRLNKYDFDKTLFWKKYEAYKAHLTVKNMKNDLAYCLFEVKIQLPEN